MQALVPEGPQVALVLQDRTPLVPVSVLVVVLVQTRQQDPAGGAGLMMSIPVEVQVVLGGTTMPVATLMNLGRGAVITLDKQIGDPVDIVVNGRVIARGEVIVMEDDSSRFGVSLTEIIGK